MNSLIMAITITLRVYKMMMLVAVNLPGLATTVLLLESPRNEGCNFLTSKPLLNSDEYGNKNFMQCNVNKVKVSKSY